MVRISLVPALTLLYLHASTFRSMCAVPNMAVFCSSLTSCYYYYYYYYYYLLLYLRQRDICCYPEPGQSSPPPSPFYFLGIHFNIIIPSAPGFARGLLPLDFPNTTPFAFLFCPLRGTRPTFFIVSIIT